MREYQFTTVISGNLETDAVHDALFEAGCDDATFGSIDGVGYGDFFREAPSFAEALCSAISAVESVEGLRVLRIEPDDLATMKEIADRLGRSRESVRLLISGARGPGRFPPPFSHLKARNRLWKWSDVVVWAESNEILIVDKSWNRESAFVIATMNAALALRDSLGCLEASEQAVVQSFVQAVAA